MPKEKTTTFEEDLKQLEEIVSKLENGETPLDDAIKEFTKAIELTKKCNSKLTEAEEKITQLVNEDGTLENFEVNE